MLQLDHIAVAAETLAAATAHSEAALGCALLSGGKHARFGTHNRLLGLEDGLYFEAIAIDPTAPKPDRPRWFGLDDFAGPARLDKWIMRTPDMATALKALPMAGSPVTLERDGLRWTMAVPDDGRLPFDGVFPAIIEWHSAPIPGESLPSSGRRLDRLTISHPEARALQDLLAPHLEAPLVSFQTGSPGMQADLTHEGQGLCLR